MNLFQTAIKEGPASPEPPSFAASRTNSGSSSLGSSPDIDVDVVGATPKPYKAAALKLRGMALDLSSKSNVKVECEMLVDDIIEEEPILLSNSVSQVPVISRIDHETVVNVHRSPSSVFGDGLSYNDMGLKDVGGGPLKRYLCQRCLNHGEHWPRKGHKPFCRYVSCSCSLCIMVDERRRLNNAICRQTSVSDEEKGSTTGSTSKVRNPMCARCSAHGVQNRLKNHKKRCPHAECTCDLCKLVDERRDLMARQIKLRRQQNQRRRLLASGPPSPMEHTGGGVRLPTVSYPYDTNDEAVDAHGSSILRAAFTGTRPVGMGMRPGISSNGIHESPISSPTNNPEAPNFSFKPYSNESLTGNLAPIMSTGAMPRESRIEDYSLPQTQTLFIPVQVPVNQMMHHEGGERCRSQNCISCLEEALRHELKMAELLRMVASNNVYGNMLDRLHAVHQPQSNQFVGGVDVHGHGLTPVSHHHTTRTFGPMVTHGLMNGFSPVTQSSPVTHSKEAMMARARAELALMLQMNNPNHPERSATLLN